MFKSRKLLAAVALVSLSVAALPTGAQAYYDYYYGGYGYDVDDNPLIGNDDPLAGQYGDFSSQFVNDSYNPNYYYNSWHDGYDYGSYDNYGYTYQANNMSNYQYVLPGGSTGQLYATQNEFTGDYELYDPSNGQQMQMSASQFNDAIANASLGASSYNIDDLTNAGYGDYLASVGYNNVASSAGGATGGSSSLNFSAMNNLTSSLGSSASTAITNGLSSQASSALSNYFGGSGMNFTPSSSQSTLSFCTSVNTGVTKLSQSGAASNSFMSAIGGAGQIAGISSLSDFYGSFADASFLQNLPGGIGGSIANALDGAANSLGDAAAGAASDFFSGIGDSFDLGGDWFGDFSFGDMDFGSMFDGFDLGSLDFGGFDFDFDLGGLTDGLGDVFGSFDMSSILGSFDLSSITGSITEGLTSMLSDSISGMFGDLLGSFDIGGMIGGLFG